MHSHYDSMYLSPHLDDVALSCGGQICLETAAGNSVLVVTIMAGDPQATTLSDFAQSLHERWQLGDGAVARRRAEDVKAWQVLGADFAHWELADCVYRSHPETGVPLYSSEEAIFGQLHPAESLLQSELTRSLADLPPSGRIVVPLTVGNHVDHQLTRLAAEQWLDPGSLLYYEDYPYAGQKDALAAVIGLGHEWRPESIALTPAALQAKIEAVACYDSQLSTFFYGPEDLAAQIGQYVASVGGERLWRWRPTS